MFVLGGFVLIIVFCNFVSIFDCDHRSSVVRLRLMCMCCVCVYWVRVVYVIDALLVLVTQSSNASTDYSERFF